MKPEEMIKELEDACVHYAAREEQLIDMLQRIAEIIEEPEEYHEVYDV